MMAAAKARARRETMQMRRGPTVLGGLERSGEITRRLAALEAKSAAWCGDDQAGAVLLAEAQRLEPKA